MAKPRELFNTPAPQAMSMMGQGIADAYARAGEIEGKGMMAMGQGIAQGITSAASSIAGYMKEAKQLEAQNKSYESFLGNKVGQTILGYTPEQSQQLIGEARKIALDGGIRAGNDYLNLVVGGRLQQQNKMQQIQAANPVKPVPSYPAITFEESPLSTLTPSPAPSGGMTVGSGLGSGAISPQTASDDDVDYVNFLRKKGWAGGPVKQAWVDEYNSLNQIPYFIRR